MQTSIHRETTCCWKFSFKESMIRFPRSGTRQINETLGSRKLEAKMQHILFVTYQAFSGGPANFIGFKVLCGGGCWCCFKSCGALFTDRARCFLLNFWALRHRSGPFVKFLFEQIVDVQGSTGTRTQLRAYCLV